MMVRAKKNESFENSSKSCSVILSQNKRESRRNFINLSNVFPYSFFDYQMNTEA